jgi:hypothetical protein
MSKGYRIKPRVVGSKEILFQVQQASSFLMPGNRITADAKDQNVSR